MPPKFNWELYHDELHQLYLIDQYPLDQVIEQFRRSHQLITPIPRYIELKSKVAKLTNS